MQMNPRGLPPEKRRQNLKTAMIMVSIAVAFFLGYIIKAKYL